MTLFELSSEQRTIEALLEENGGELTPEIESMMAETEDLFPKKVDGYGVMLRKFQSMEKMCDDEIKRVQGLKKVAQNSIKSMRSHLLDTMLHFGFQKLKGNMTQMWVGKSKSVEVDEEVLLAKYKAKIEALQESLPPYLTVEVKVSKKAVSDAYKAGGVLPPGCEINENDTLTIK